PGCCQIEQWDYAAAQRAFVRALVTEVRPARAAGLGY
ncbi:MAG: DNA repair exonuclease, partial [Alphaproteobacteria bacterium]|nr:DNA repair exonuclease [Alphaproteobacteria bacterium]